MEGRQILDAVVVATETIHSMANSKEKAMFIKVDMARHMTEFIGPSFRRFWEPLVLRMNGLIGL